MEACHDVEKNYFNGLRHFARWAANHQIGKTMSLNDPAHLVERIPELEALAAEPRIRKAIETGDSFKVYRAIVWAKWFRRLPEHQQTLNTLVRHRRLFAKPLNGTPALGSINSVGFGFVGRSEKEADGTFIAKHAFVVLYIIPIIPLRSYLVEKVGGSLFSSQWQIYARVPSGIIGLVYSRTLAAMIGISVIAGIVGGIERSRTKDIYVVNGFDVPVDVVLDGQARTVAPFANERIHVKAGQVEGKATAKGVTLDTFSQQVASSSNHSVWNVAGAAPLFREAVPYYKQAPAKPPAEAEDTVYCGQKFVEVDGVDDAFTTPPQSVSMSKHTDKVIRTHLDVARVDGQAGYMSCMHYLASHKQGKLAARFMELEAELKGWDNEATAYAMLAAADNSKADAARVARRALDAKPDDVAFHKQIGEYAAAIARKQD